ncbi:GyrI-like domain-containing protein [Bacillota bacterium Meth-B3]
MEWLGRLNAAMQYLEAHLDGEIELTRMAQIACCSPFHFQRMFSYLAEVPLSEYIRRRRMTMAAADMQAGRGRVIDIALKYGYDSPTAFNRAFQGVHGIAPTEARRPGARLKAYLPLSFYISIKGEVEMNYRIEQKEAFRIVGVKAHYTLSVEQNFTEVPAFWQQTAQSGSIGRILALANREPKALLGVTSSMTGPAFDYYIAAASDADAPEGMEAFTVPACTWAIFPCVGAMPHAIQALQKRVIGEWLPASGYEYADAPDIELCFEGDQQAEDYRCEVWLPVTKK